MSVKEQIQSEISAIPEEHLDELYGLIKDFRQKNNGNEDEGIIARLRAIQIEGPPDFAANFELYKSGEKRVEDGIH